MSETYLKYKGYLGTIEPQLEDNTLYGKVAFIRDLVTYEATTLEKLKQEFEASIDDYLGFCEEQGKKPDTPLVHLMFVQDKTCIVQLCWHQVTKV